MIISCEKCNKKFELSDELIPVDGRLLKCGSCSYEWHYVPNKTIKLSKEVVEEDMPKNLGKTTQKRTEKKDKKNKIDENNNFLNEKKRIGFLSIIIVVVISFIAILIIIDTFKLYIVSFVPNIDFYLSSLYESLKDLFLFFKDLIK